MKLKCLQKGFYFDNIVFQLNWKNPELLDNIGKFMTLFEQELEFEKISSDEGGKLHFRFTNYDKIIGSIQMSRLWFKMDHIDSTYNLDLFRDKVFKVASKSVKNIPPIHVSGIGIRIAVIYDNNSKEKFLNLVPFRFQSVNGDLYNARLQWVHQNNSFHNKFELYVHVQTFYGEKPSNIQLPTLPDEGIVLDVDFITNIKKGNNISKILTVLKNEVFPDTLRKFDEIADELLQRLG